MSVPTQHAPYIVSQPTTTPTNGNWRHARLVAVLLLAPLLLWYTGLAWVTPSPSSSDALAADARAHRVVSWRVSGQPADFLQELLSDSSADDSVMTVVWSRPDGRRFWVSLDDLDGTAAATSGTPTIGSPDDTADAATGELSAWLGQSGNRAWWWAVGLPGVAILGGLASVVAVVSRRHQTGTRWFWFWVLGLPAGLGTLWFVLAEVLGRGRPRADLRRGWLGLVIAIAATTVANCLVLAAS